MATLPAPCPPPARPLVRCSARTQSPPIRAPGPRGRARGECGGRCGCGASFRGVGFGRRGKHSGPNLPEAEVFFSLTLQAASGGAEPPLSPPPPRRLIRGLSVPPGDAGPGRALGSAPSGLANFAGPAARRAAPRAHVRSGCGAAGTSAGLGDQGLSPAPGRGASCWPEAGAGRLCPPPLPGRSSARRAESLAGGPGSGGAAPPRTPGARRPPGQEKQRPPRPPQRLGRAAGRLGRSLAEPAALGFPGSASGEPLLPEPSGSCAGRVSRGRARRRRRRRRGEGGRALPRGRD